MACFVQLLLMCTARLTADVPCRFLIDTFGREALAEGSGVLDIGGGKGEISFELLNLNNIRATVVDPRPGSLSKQAKWLKVSPTSCKACRFYSAHLMRLPVALMIISLMALHPLAVDT